MPTFPLLADPATYNPHTMDLVDDAAMRERWLRIFEAHSASLTRHAIDSAGGDPTAAERAAAMDAQWRATLQGVRDHPERYGELSVLWFCVERENSLRAHGFDDPYRHVKAAENDRALQLLPGLLGEYDALDDADRLEAIMTGCFAGNIFDLGVEATSAMFDGDGGFDFHRAIGRVKPRPWFVDTFDPLRDRFDGGAWRKAVVFVDNAGADVVLGMVPLCRALVGRGCEVVMTANTSPALNDILHHELVPLMRRVAGFDRVTERALAEGRLKLVPSGNGAPLIDLRRVGVELAEAAAGADLVILHGMGRAVETNYHARFKCDALKMAMLKEPAVAEPLGGGMYDVVCKFEPVSGAGC